ncbi:biopolymer transporter Tol [Verrucomicrobia bacterium LW23]|nr:biopolymer transporter Tol [Verrucomicrobia bacterium LW23]
MSISLATPSLGPLRSATITSAAVRAWLHPRITQATASGAVEGRGDGERHTIHSYFVTCPESPDARHVVFFASTTAEAHHGDIVLHERATGRETILARGVTTEDAHRAACQQWIGRHHVAFHDFRDGRWVVAAVDTRTGRERILAADRLLGFGSPTQPWVPVYGRHWQPGPHRNVELIHVETGEVRTALTSSQLVAAYPAEVEELLGPDAASADLSLFFPVLSPDATRAMIKLSRASGLADFRSNAASRREGRWVYDFEQQRFLSFARQWGHPSWTPDSAGIFNKGNELTVLAASDGTEHVPIKFATGSPNDHPSVSPESNVFVTDGSLAKFDTGRPGEWGIVIGSLEAGVDEFATIHRFNHAQGAASWRKVHPHPAFSADGRRVYFNVSDGRWTRLWVAERSA